MVSEGDEQVAGGGSVAGSRRRRQRRAGRRRGRGLSKSAAGWPVPMWLAGRRRPPPPPSSPSPPPAARSTRPYSDTAASAAVAAGEAGPGVGCSFRSRLERGYRDREGPGRWPKRGWSRSSTLLETFYIQKRDCFWWMTTRIFAVHTVFSKSTRSREKEIPPINRTASLGVCPSSCRAVLLVGRRRHFCTAELFGALAILV
jgi:hypothetical protein